MTVVINMAIQKIASELFFQSPFPPSTKNLLINDCSDKYGNSSQNSLLSKIGITTIGSLKTKGF